MVLIRDPRPRSLKTRLSRFNSYRIREAILSAAGAGARFGLDQLPQQPYPEALWNEKVDAVWQHVFQTYRSPPPDFRAAA
jgi:hypothetical protein